MSLSVEDLCASLASSHVGQEAMDLAALQVQLAQTLFIATSSSRCQDEYAQPCNTPTRRTPSASFSWGPMVDHSRHDLPSHWNSDIILCDETAEDERMVEDLLLPNSPMSAKPQTPTSTASQAQLGSACDPSPSQFTTTDPFYLAQLQAAQNYGVAPPSVFSQAAFPSAQSPFMIHTNLQRHNPVQNPLSMPIDPHPLLVAAPTSFDR